jgi:hypothetical protein
LRARPTIQGPTRVRRRGALDAKLQATQESKERDAIDVDVAHGGGDVSSDARERMLDVRPLERFEQLSSRFSQQHCEGRSEHDLRRFALFVL